MPKTPDKLQHKLRSLPKKPGVYQFFDKDAKIIYVGKAKVLKNRVNSYFNSEHLESGKTRIMVAINQQMNDVDVPISGNDEIAFFPPVTGG